MKFLFDFSHPKQSLFFPPIIRELEKRGHIVEISSREFGREKNFILKLLNQNGIDTKDAFVVGGYGRTKYDKLMNFCKRTEGLGRFMKQRNIDALVCLSSPSAVRAAYGLGIPVFCFNDIPEAVHTATLTIPFSDWLFYPFCIERHVMVGFHPKNLFEYQALDPIVWLKSFVPNKEYYKEFGLRDKYIIVKHTPMSTAFNTGKTDLIVELTNWLSKEFDVAVHSYDVPIVEKEMKNAIILKGIVDLQSLISGSSLLVTGGGTTSIEAAYFNIPVVSARPILTYYDKFLIWNGLMFHSRNLEKLKETCIKRLGRKFKIENPLHKMEFPMKKIVDIMEDYL